MKLLSNKISKSKLTKLTIILTSIILTQSVYAAPSDDFVITIKSDNVATLPTEFTIPTNGTGYNYSVDCNNDGVNEATGVTGDYTCDYAALSGAGTYTIRIKDSSGGSGGTDFPAIFFNSSGFSRLKLLTIDQWGTGVWRSMTAAFSGTSNMDIVATDTPDLSMVPSLTAMFQGATSLVGTSANWNWDVSNVIRMNRMFIGASSFDQDISTWDVTNVIDFTGFLTGGELSPGNYDALLTAWDALDLTDGLTFDAGSSQLCNAVVAYSDIQINDGWSFNDGGLAPNCPLSGASIITVGSVGSTCDITTGSTKIQDAIDFGPNTIRLVNSETYNENIIIDNIDIEIIGGFASCADAGNGIRNANDKSIINGSSNSQSTIRIFGSSQFNNVNLTGLEITGGTSNALGGGGILTFGADAQLILTNVLVHNSTGRFGGGIAILASTNRTNLFVFDSIIKSNTANEEGGGLYCRYTGSGIKPIIEIRGLSGFSDNNAIDGGGIYLNQCGFTSYSGDDDITSDIGINRNSSTGKGGGIYATNASILDLNGHEICGLGCSGSNSQPFTIAGNSAQDNGGGVFLSGFQTELNANSLLLKDNVSDNDGGGFAITDGATLTVQRLQKECWDEDNCNLLTGNKSGTAFGLGGLLYNNAAIANIHQSELIFNQADLGSILYTSGANAVTTFIGCLIRDNGGLRIGGSFVYDDEYIFRVETDAQLNVYHSTIADNLSDTAVFSISNTALASEVVNSIIHDATTGFVINPSNSIQASFRYNIVHEDNTISIISLSNSTTDPLFVNRNVNDYHIDAINSLAIDYGLANHSFIKDLDFEDRGVDDPTINDFFGPYDLGAYESRRPDVIFSDSFEN